MINYMIDYMENVGVVFASQKELAEVTVGIRKYLLENGIPENDRRDYFKQYLNRSLSRVDRHELKQYFLAYPVISSVRQICIEFRANGGISETRKTDLLNDMSVLYMMGLGDKYIPAVEVKEILGKLA